MVTVASYNIGCYVSANGVNQHCYRSPYLLSPIKKYPNTLIFIENCLWILWKWLSPEMWRRVFWQITALITGWNVKDTFGGIWKKVVLTSTTCDPGISMGELNESTKIPSQYSRGPSRVSKRTSPEYLSRGRLQAKVVYTNLLVDTVGLNIYASNLSLSTPWNYIEGGEV
jgi:hypothetical protein